MRNAREVLTSGLTELDLPFTKIIMAAVVSRGPRAVMAILLRDVVSLDWDVHSGNGDK